MGILQKKHFLILILMSVSLFLPLLLNKSSDTQAVVLNAKAIEISVSSDEDKLSDGSYLIGSEITFEITDDGYENVSLSFKGGVNERLFSYDLEKGASKWALKWDTNEPKPNDDPVDSGEYVITLEIDQEEKDCDPSSIKMSSGEATIPMWLIVIIIVAIAAGISVSAFFVIKRKRSKGEAVKFGEVDKTKAKKKGKVYEGASAIGKRSGDLAEEKVQMKKSDEEATVEKFDIKPASGAKIDKPFGIDTKPQKQPEVLMPASDEYQFETKTAKSAALLKEMESKMDLESKVDMFSSKSESILQNIEFFKVILSQQEQEELACKTCKKKMAKFWVMCPYCLTHEKSAELGLKQSMMSMGEGVKFCPECKRIIQPNWIACPYCFSKKTKS